MSIDHVATPIRDPRIYLAAERTFLAWVRTGLAMMGFGFVVARFGIFLREVVVLKTDIAKGGPSLSLWVGTALVILGVVTTVFGMQQQLRFRARWDRGEDFETPSSAPVLLLAISLAAIGVAMAGYLVLRAP